MIAIVGALVATAYFGRAVRRQLPQRRARLPVGPARAEASADSRCAIVRRRAGALAIDLRLEDARHGRAQPRQGPARAWRSKRWRTAAARAARLGARRLGLPPAAQLPTLVELVGVALQGTHELTGLLPSANHGRAPDRGHGIAVEVAPITSSMPTPPCRPVPRAHRSRRSYRVRSCRAAALDLAAGPAAIAARRSTIHSRHRDRRRGLAPGGALDETLELAFEPCSTATPPDRTRSRPACGDERGVSCRLDHDQRRRPVRPPGSMPPRPPGRPTRTTRRPPISDMAPNSSAGAPDRPSRLAGDRPPERVPESSQTLWQAAWRARRSSRRRCHRSLRHGSSIRLLERPRPDAARFSPALYSTPALSV